MVVSVTAVTTMAPVTATVTVIAEPSCVAQSWEAWRGCHVKSSVECTDKLTLRGIKSLELIQNFLQLNCVELTVDTCHMLQVQLITKYIICHSQTWRLFYILANVAWALASSPNWKWLNTEQTEKEIRKEIERRRNEKRKAQIECGWWLKLAVAVP